MSFLLKYGGVRCRYRHPNHHPQSVLLRRRSQLQSPPSPLIDDDVIIIEPLVKPEVVQAFPIQVGTRGSRAPSREGANKGKAPAEESTPIYMTNYGVDTPSREATITIKMHFKATD